MQRDKGPLRGPIDSNRSFPVMSTFDIVLATLETLSHMLYYLACLALMFNCLLESSRLIAKASLSVMILRSLLEVYLGILYENGSLRK